MRTHLFNKVVAVASTSLLIAFTALQVSASGSSGPQAQSDATTSQPSVSAQVLASEIETLGQSEYPQSFEGAVLDSDGSVNVFGTASGEVSIMSAISTLSSSESSVNYEIVGQSLSDLLAISANIRSNISELATEGIDPSSFGPNTQSDNVEMSLVAPTTSQLNQMDVRLSSEGEVATTSSTYLSNAQSLIASEFGPSVVLDAQYGTIGTDDGRTNDTAPFYGGDHIYGGEYNADCTGGFSVVGNASGKDFMLTAGHCGTGAWYANSAKTTFMGNVSAAYFTNGGSDFSTIYMTGGGQGHVWANGGTSHPLNGQLLPAVGAQITFDGAGTGEVPGNYVTGTYQTVEFYDAFNQSDDYTYPLVIATNPNGTTICAPGDSGGPVYQRESGVSSVYAVGTIVACYQGTNSPTGAAQQIGSELSQSNTSILQG
jgi:hypothetical protein